jgi:predicted amidohydrolase YtcJ
VTQGLGWLLLLGATGCGGADLVLRHGAVYTVDPGRSWAEAVAVDGGRIVYVGPDAGVETFVGGGTEVVDLGGRMLLPGFHDSHAHVLEGGISLGLLDLSDLGTREAILDAVRAWAAAHPDEDWIVGFGWALPIFPGANPSKADLDAIVPDRPVYLGAADGHSAWVNSRALAEAGITAATPDPPKGRIERDPATGEPSGTLREAAMDLASARAHDFGGWRAIQGLRRGVAHANRHGITSFVDARATPDHARVYRILDLLGLLHARVTLSLAVDPGRGEEQVAELREHLRRDEEHELSVSAAKIFVDGVIEARTAALVDPYLGGDGGTGLANFEPERLDALGTALDAAGFDLHFHAIGDRGVRMALDAVAAARRANGARDTRPQIAHLELVRPEDVARFRELGVVADFQPLWAFPDPYVTELTIPVLGPERSRWIYPIGSLVRSGAVVAAGSDWPVSSVDPLDAIEVALTRESPDGSVAGVLLPGERVDLAAMLAAYTIGGAFVQHQEDFTGSIEPGKAADLVVLDRNLFATPPAEISEARVLLTLLAGEEVWRDPAAAF